jgi:hypothetical protein
MPMKAITKTLLAALLVLAPLSSFAGIFISIGIAPPPLPVYVQPACPYDGYLWVPGYWAYGDFGYFWVPGTWVQPPRFGLLWTPGYWGWGGDNFYFHEGYWGPHVGFYGGVNYGFGYGGRGYGGGRWQGGHFFYNSAANNVNITNVHNTYVDRTTINNVTNNISYNGGSGGVAAQPTVQERQFAHESHVRPTPVQQSHVQTASLDRSQLASANGGRPATLAAPRADTYKRVAQQHAASQPLTKVTVPKTSTTAGTNGLEKRTAPSSSNASNQSTVGKTAETKHASHEKSGPKKDTHPKPPAHPKPKAQPHPKAKADSTDKNHKNAAPGA